MRKLIALFVFVLSFNIGVAQEIDSVLRIDNCIYYIDGVRVRGVNCDLDSISNVEIVTGGLPVNYGDLNGPFIILKSKEKSKGHIAPLSRASL